MGSGRDRVATPGSEHEPLPYDVRKFKIFVNEHQSFLSNFEVLETSWKGTDKDITKVAVDTEDHYFASLLAACIISHVGGISRKHLIESEKIPKVVTSIARYYVYYHMKRFLEDPRKMDSYITNEMKKLVKTNLQTKTLWKRKFVRTRVNISYWYQNHPNRHNIRKYRYVMSSNNTGVLGIEYEEVDHVIPKSDEDWTIFIKEDSDGLTKTGQNLLLNHTFPPFLVRKHKPDGLSSDKEKNRYKPKIFSTGS